MAFIHLSTAARNAAANAIVDLIDVGSAVSTGRIEIYDGSAPATPGDAITTQTLLAVLPFSNPAFGAASGGVVTSGSITVEDAALDTGTAGWARIFDRNNTAVMDVDVGESDATLILNTVSIIESAVVQISAGSFTMPSGT